MITLEDLILQINDLRSYFLTDQGEARAVDGVSIAVPRGKTVGIVGESGCGKSMTAKSILGLLKYPGRITGGEILFEGADLTKRSERELRRIRGKDISMIFQEPMTSLNPVVKVGRQVREAVLLHQRCSRAEAKKRVYEAFRQVGVSEPEKRYECYPHQLSGGLRQRIMIAMAMICKPRLLIADEPTTALDVTIEAQILRLMKDLSAGSGMSIILISHNLGVIAQMCDYVYVMYAGKIVEEGDVFTLFEDPRHPYTAGLLNSIIKPDERRRRLTAIPGMVPNLLHLPDGCAFCDRCAHANSRCRSEKPELYGEGHRTRCFLRERGGAD